MFKVVATAPEWFGARGIDHVYAVSGCICSNFMDFTPLWRHNGWWFFDSPMTLNEVAAANGLDPTSFNLFYYEAFESEYDADEKIWRPIEPETSFVTKVETPETKRLCGYDVVTFSVHASPECSPLSCNMLAKKMSVNGECLFDQFATAHELVERGAFNGSEPGPYRIIAVYSVPASQREMHRQRH
jgi:hypothetical protein